MLLNDFSSIPVPDCLCPSIEGVCNVKIIHLVHIENDHVGEILKVYFETESEDKFIQDIEVSDDVRSLYVQFLDLIVTGGYRRTGDEGGYLFLSSITGAELTAVIQDNGETNEIVAFLPYGTSIEEMSRIVSPYLLDLDDGE